MRILAAMTSYWNGAEQARRYEHTVWSFKGWCETADRLFAPVAKVVACGTWSDPAFCPVQELIVVNSGVINTGTYNGRRRHYCRCALTAMCAYALNRGDWDLLVHWENDCFFGDIDFEDILTRFMTRQEILLAPSMYGFPGGPLLVFKRDAVQRWMHYRTTPSMVDEGSPDIRVIIENEFAELYERKWWNPWPTFDELLYRVEQPNKRPVDQNWPMACYLDGNELWRYLKEKCPLTKPLSLGRSSPIPTLAGS